MVFQYEKSKRKVCGYMDSKLLFSGRLDSIQLLRAIASLGVALYHIQFLFATGINFSLGVHVFFVISAFLMMYTTQQKPRNFLTKRLIRIVPLYWIMTFLTYIAATALPNLMPSAQVDIKQLIFSMFFLPYARSGLRIEQTIRPLVGPGWTLYYEIYFTFLFALSMKNSHKYRGIATGAILAIMLAVGRTVSSDNIYFKFWTSTYISDFIAGIVAFYVIGSIAGKKVKKSEKVLLTGLSILAWAVMLLNVVPQPRWLFNCILSAFILTATVIVLNNVEIPRWIVWGGNVSYSFYLIHYYVIIIIGKVFDFSQSDVKAWIGVALVLVVSELIALLSHQLVEVWFSNKVLTLYNDVCRLKK